MKSLWIIIHSWPRGIEAWAIRSAHQPGEREVTRLLDIQYKRGKAFGESLEILPAEQDEVLELSEPKEEHRPAGPSF